MVHGKTVWRPPLKDKEGRLTASGYGIMHSDMLARCSKQCTKDINYDCNKCSTQKVIDYIIKKHISRHAEGCATNCVCDFATCDILSVGKCKQFLTKETLQEWVDNQGAPHKVDDI